MGQGDENARHPAPAQLALEDVRGAKRSLKLITERLPRARQQIAHGARAGSGTDSRICLASWP